MWSPKSLWTILDSLRYSECLPSIVVRNASIQRIEENKSIAGSLIFFACHVIVHCVSSFGGISGDLLRDEC